MLSSTAVRMLADYLAGSTGLPPPSVRPTSAGGSKPAVHLNLVPSSTPSPDSPKLRAVYSPCTCTGPVAMGVAALSPRAAAAGARAACCGLARSPAGARSYTSD